MRTKFQIGNETLGYVTNEESTNTDMRYLIAGSKNVLIDTNRKVGIRNGFSRLGAGNDALTPVRNAFTWLNSTGVELPLRFYDDEWEVYLGTVDTTELNAWYRFKSAMDDEAIVRGALFFDTVENIDEMILVQGDANLYEWNGAVAVVSSVTANTITKAGTSTFAQNRFYTSANRTLINVRTGTEFTYSGGESTTTLTGVSGSPITDGMIAGDVLIQKVVTASDEPAASHTNDTIYSFENQICVGSFDDNEVWISQNDDYADFTYSTPRLAGEGGLLTLDGPSRGMGSVGKYLLAFAGQDGIFRADYQQITVGTTLAEALRVKKLNAGSGQGALNPDCIVQMGNAIVYLSNEPALRIIENPDNLDTTNPRTLSNPIKPDFDAEVWTNAKGLWHKNALWLAAPTNSHLYALQFIEDADGKVRRYWQPPQTLPVDPFFVYAGGLHGGSNGVAETYLLFDPETFSDLIANGTLGDPDDKTPIDAKAKYAYQNYKDRASLKTFDEYYIEGEISPSTIDLLLTLGYDFEGATQILQKTIDGSDEDVLEGTISGNSLAEQALGQQPLGGLLNPPSNARKFRLIFEFAREDFYELVPEFSTNELDRYWAIIAHGANAVASPRRGIHIKK